MMTVSLQVQIDPTWRPSDRLQIYTDSGSGTVDDSAPLLATPAEIFPDEARDLVEFGGHGSWSHGSVPHGGAISVASPDKLKGHGSWPHGSVPHGGGPAYAVIEVQIPQAFGDWKFSAEAIDGAGNVQGALSEFTQRVSGEDPLPLTSFSFSSFNIGTDTATFAVAV